VVCGTTDTVEAYPRFVPIAAIESGTGTVSPIDALIDDVNLCVEHVEQVRASDVASSTEPILGWCHTGGWGSSTARCNECGTFHSALRSRFA
jgi:hypothetical protein